MQQTLEVGNHRRRDLATAEGAVLSVAEDHGGVVRLLSSGSKRSLYSSPQSAMNVLSEHCRVEKAVVTFVVVQMICWSEMGVTSPF